MRRCTLLFFFLFLAATPDRSGASDEIYAWALSASATDPFVQVSDSLAAPGLFDVWLWLVCHEADGIAAAEFGVTVGGNLVIATFEPLGPQIINFGDGTGGNLRLAIGGCPEPPFVAGRLLVIDLGGGGNLCLAPSFANGLNVSVDCGYPQPTAHPNGALGFSSDGSAPCVVGDCVDSSTPVGGPDIEASTWGRIKGTYR